MILMLLSIILAGAGEKDFCVRLEEQNRNVTSTTVVVSPLQLTVASFCVSWWV